MVVMVVGLGPEGLAHGSEPGGGVEVAEEGLEWSLNVLEMCMIVVSC